MSETASRSDLHPSAAAPYGKTNLRSIRRAAGWGGVAAFVAWLAQPFVVLVLAASGDEYRSWDDILASPYLGAVEALIFAGIGVGILFLVLGVHALMVHAGAVGVAAAVGTATGVAAGIMWFLAAGASLVLYTSVGAGLPDIAPDESLQIALIDTLAMAMTGTLVAFALLMSCWVVVLITVGRRAGVVGWPMTIVGILALAGVFASILMPFSAPWGLIAHIAFALVLGIVLLVTSRRRTT